MSTENKPFKINVTTPSNITTHVSSDVQPSDRQWDRFKDFVKNIAAVPKEEVDGLRAEHEREKKERKKRAR